MLLGKSDATADWALGLGMGKRSIIVGHSPKGDRSEVLLWADASHGIISLISSSIVMSIKCTLALLHSRDSLLEEFDEEIFNALVEKIEDSHTNAFCF